MKNRVIALFLCLTSAAALGDTVEAAARREAYQLYPDLQVAGSALAEACLAERARLQRENPEFFANPSWPLILARSVAPEKVYIRFTVLQTVSDGALVEALIGRLGQVRKEVDWAHPSLLDGHRRSDTVVGPGIAWTGEKTTVYVLGLMDYPEKRSGEIAVYEAGNYNYSTVLGAARRVPLFATTISRALSVRRSND